jgi:hypothetical protein
VGDVLAQDLDGHRSPARVERKVHDAHATLAKWLDESIRTDSLPRTQHY